MDILRFSFDFLKRLQIYRRSDQRSHFDSFYHHIRDFSDQLCSTALIDNQLFFYYEIEDPLNAYLPQKTPKIDSQCRNYHRYLSKSYATIASFDFKIPISELSYDTFLSLHQKFREFLQYRLHKYCRGSGSIH